MKLRMGMKLKPLQSRVEWQHRVDVTLNAVIPNKEYLYPEVYFPLFNKNN